MEESMLAEAFLVLKVEISGGEYSRKWIFGDTEVQVRS
jgi:hypothetical protein